jgi:hypothetical protein
MFDQFINEFIQPVKNNENLPIQKDSSGSMTDKEIISSPEGVDLNLQRFKLPILYLAPNELHPLSETVSNDLELYQSPTNNAMYDHLFKPTHSFARKIIPEWNKQFTSNIEFLEDTKNVLKDTRLLKNQLSVLKYSIDDNKLMEIWNHTKNNPEFLSKYSFIEWDIVKHFNRSTTFLQYLSLIHIMSPIMSLAFPFFLLLFPFLILKAQGVPITFDVYFDVLKSIAQNHYIGKVLTNIGKASPDKVIYLIVTVGLYFLQIYQNIIQCHHFYKNITRINDYLFEMKQYVFYSIQSMENFIEIHRNKRTYQPFLLETNKHLVNLQLFYSEIINIQPFELTFSKFGELGYLLKCFYELHSNKDYEEALDYSFGFEGYVNNLFGVFENLESGAVSFVSFDISGSCNIEKQYYPPLIQSEVAVIKNNCSFDKNMIISAPNAGGKTTIIKTTAINIIFSQQLGCGFYKSCTLNPYTHIHSYLNIPDTSGRDSLFQAESRRCKEIIDIIHKSDNLKDRHFGIFDELYSGTNPIEATKSAFAFLLYLSKFSNVNFVLTTHYVAICKKFSKSDRIQNYKMVVKELDNGKLEYTYKLKKGISKIQGAITILKQMEYPEEIIETIRNY